MEDAKLYCIRIVTLHPLPPHSKQNKTRKTQQILNKWWASWLREATCVSDFMLPVCAAAGLVLGSAGEGNRLASSAVLAHTNFNDSLPVFHIGGPSQLSLRELWVSMRAIRVLWACGHRVHKFFHIFLRHPVCVCVCVCSWNTWWK